MTLNGSLCEKTNYGVLSPPRMKQNSNTLVRRKESLLSRHTRSNKILIINVLSLRFGSWLFAEVYWHKDKKMMKVNRLNYRKINFNSPTSNCVTFIFCNLALIIFSKPPQTLSRRYRVYISLSPCLKFKLIKAALQTLIWFVIKQCFMVTFTVQRYLSKTVLWLQSNSSIERSGNKVVILNWTEHVKIY